VDLYPVQSTTSLLQVRSYGVSILFSDDSRRSPGPNFVAVDPLFDGLRSDARWPELVRRLSLPTAQAQ
jgi:hypothetical protein